LTDALWPDSEGDDANNALKTAVHRLRKLLGQPDAIEVSAGHLSLNPQICWTDLGSFELLVEEAHNEAEKYALLEQAINLYRGRLLSSEEDVSWIVAPSERVRSKFLDAVTMVGQYRESKQQWAKAIDVYDRALEVDHLIESFYLRLMHCHQELGHHGEALITYERCSKTLAAELGVEPSPVLQSFGRELTNL
jgi:DNA-binding SARP family transcriptional activator